MISVVHFLQVMRILRFPKRNLIFGMHTNQSSKRRKLRVITDLVPRRDPLDSKIWWTPRHEVSKFSN